MEPDTFVNVAEDRKARDFDAIDVALVRPVQSLLRARSRSIRLRQPVTKPASPTLLLTQRFRI